MSYIKVKLKPLVQKNSNEQPQTTKSVYKKFHRMLKHHKKSLQEFREKQAYHFNKNPFNNNTSSEEEDEEQNNKKKREYASLINAEETKKNINLIFENCHKKYKLHKNSSSSALLSKNKSSQLGDYVYNQVDFNKTRYSDKHSFNVFYQKFHKSQEYIRKNVSNTSTPSFKFINSANHNLIVPNPTGLVRREGPDSSIDINHKRMGDNYVQCLADGLSVAEHVTSLSLSQNRLTDKSVSILCDTLDKNNHLARNLILLNLSYNKLGENSITHLCNFINNCDCCLEHINLEANCLGNRLVLKVLDRINERIFPVIKYLNFGQNNLNDDSASTFALTCKKCDNLTVLILYQNQFRNFGMSLIMSELKNHNFIKFIDVSWNLIGTNLNEELPTREELIKCNKVKDPLKSFNNAQLEELKIKMEFPKKSVAELKKSASVASLKVPQISPFTKELCALFRNKSTELIHLDISHNNIGYTDCSQIAIDVKKNHSILGIHVDGNDMIIDELGFIYPVTKAEYEMNHFANSQIFYRIDKENPLIKSNIINVKKIRGKNNCWICEGWNEVKFTYKPTVKPVKKTKCKLFLNFENYKGFDMVYKEDTGEYLCYRMCPPGKLFFYFTYNKVPVENYGDITCSIKNAIIHKEEIKEKKDDSDEESSSHQIETINNGIETSREVNPNQHQYIISKVAKTNVLINTEVIEPNILVKMLKYCIPRPEKIINAKKRPRTPWTFPISVWAFYGYRYEGESEKKINDAFEFDFNRGQYVNDKELKNPELLHQLKVILKKYYSKLLDSYRQISAVLGWKIWQIGQNSISEFASSCPGLLDTKYLINDVLVKVTETKNNSLDKEARKNNPNIPDNIIRHQWMMLLVKIAKDKYFRTKIKPTVPEAVQYSFEKHFDQYISQFTSNKWRQERYYNEMTDNVLRAYMPVFDAVYRSNAKQKQVGKKESVSLWLDEFTNLVSVLMDSDFPVKEIPIIYNLSMRLQVNEIDFDKHYNMTFFEFLEAFSRFVDKLSPLPSGVNKLEWTSQMRVNQDLYAKLENIIPKMFRLIGPAFKNVKEKFVFPIRDIETGLLKYDEDNPFYTAVSKLLPPKGFGKPPTLKGKLKN